MEVKVWKKSARWGSWSPRNPKGYLESTIKSRKNTDLEYVDKQADKCKVNLYIRVTVMIRNGASKLFIWTNPNRLEFYTRRLLKALRTLVISASLAF